MGGEWTQKRCPALTLPLGVSARGVCLEPLGEAIHFTIFATGDGHACIIDTFVVSHVCYFGPGRGIVTPSCDPPKNQVQGGQEDGRMGAFGGYVLRHGISVLHLKTGIAWDPCKTPKANGFLLCLWRQPKSVRWCGPGAAPQGGPPVPHTLGLCRPHCTVVALAGHPAGVVDVGPRASRPRPTGIEESTPCSECDVLWQASPVSTPANLVLWSSGSALTLCSMSRNMYHCPCVFDTVAHCGTCSGCHRVRMSVDTPLTTVGPRCPRFGPSMVVYACVHSHGHVPGFTAPGSPSVCGGSVAPSLMRGSLHDRSAIVPPGKMLQDPSRLVVDTHLTNPTKPNPTQPNPTQPNPTPR